MQLQHYYQLPVIKINRDTVETRVREDGYLSKALDRLFGRAHVSKDETQIPDRQVDDHRRIFQPR